jgi:hypothetical protein
MADDSPSIDRREPRYQVSRARAARVVVERTGDIAPEVIEAELLDLSPSGAKVRIENVARAQFQDGILLRLECPELGLNLSISARVCWIKPAGEGFSSLGCAFTPALPEHCIQELFNKGLLERRRNSRRSVRGQAMARWEVDAATTDVGMLDISTGGFSVLSARAARPGNRLAVVPENWPRSEPEITARVQWLLRVDGGFIIGCEFCEPDDYRRLREAVCQGGPYETPRRQSGERLSLISMLGIVAIVAWVCSFFL